MLLIQNRGEAPTEAFTLLGASGSRGSDVEGVIGQFGTGAKHAINVLLRARLGLVIYCGTTRLTFGTRTIVVEDKEQQVVTVKINNRKPIDLGWVLAFGGIDWNETRMALREFVANAIDRTLLLGDELAEARIKGDFTIEQTDVCRAKAGYTRIYITETPDVITFFQNLDVHFLHFCGRQFDRILPKAVAGPCRVYREGVFVRELGQNAVCDYNLRAKDVSIDECRNLNDYSAMAAIAKLYRDAPAKDIARILAYIVQGAPIFEAKLDAYWLRSDYSQTEAQQAEWQKAWEVLYGDAVLAVPEQDKLATFANRKGFSVTTVPAGSWQQALAGYGVKTLNNVLSAAETKGHSVTEPTVAAVVAVDDVWALFELLGLTEGKDKPEVIGFEQICKANGEMYGFYQIGSGKVALRNDIEGDLLKQTALEEVTHYVTGADDCSRDIQEFTFRVITKLALS